MAAGSARPVTPHDLTQIRLVSDPQISPDGRRVAVTVTTTSQEPDEARSAIWMVDVETGRPVRFTSGAKRDSAPRWAPDGQRLAFLSDRESQGKPQLYVMALAGGEPTRLTDLAESVTDPVWSPDGTRIAFTARVSSRADGDGTSKPARVITRLKYKFDGEGFVYDRPPQVFVVAAEGGEPRRLSEGEFPSGWPAWSPDGSALAFVSERHETRDEDWADDVWLIPATGGEPRRLTDTAGPMFMPAFAPDGRRVAYLGTRYPRDDGRNARLFSVPVTAGKPTGLTEGFDRSCALQNFTVLVRPRWSSDGRSILVGVQDGAGGSVYRVDTERDRPPERLIGGERFITAFTVSADGRRIAFTASDPVAPPELFVCDGDGTGERRLTDFNGGWRREVTCSQPERFVVERAGFAIEGWVMKPAGFDPGRRVPALLWIHGGPHSVFGHYFSHEFQVYAGAGYGVIYMNPRGSQGYGEAFSRAVVGDWGGGDYEDLMAGLQEALRRHPWIDPGRLGVIGISYGGYMTAWIVGHTDRFQAACAEGSITNIASQFGASDIGHTWNPSESGALPWDDPGWYVERSPLTHARRIRTPLLLIHAEQDLRCPIDQSEQLFVALKKLGREVVLVRFPDESHRFSALGTPRHRLERQRIILDWFARHLGPGSP